MTGSFLSTAEQRIPIIIDAARDAFAEGGFAGTTVAQVADRAGISSAYVFKLFPSKQELFVAALERCFDQIVETLETAATDSDHDPRSILDAMGLAYAGLIADRTLLLLQVHAQSSANIPEIGSALRSGVGRITMTATRLSGADDAAVQHFLAIGQLCHLIVTAEIDAIDAPWAHLVSRGIRHPEQTGGDA